MLPKGNLHFCIYVFELDHLVEKLSALKKKSNIQIRGGSCVHVLPGGAHIAGGNS